MAAETEGPDVASLERRARAIIAGENPPCTDLKQLAGALRDAGRTGVVAEMLIAVARRALEGRWHPDERAELAMKVLRDHQQFGYARRLLSRVRTSATDSELLRQQHALCTYKDLELPALRRLDRALAILKEGGKLEESKDSETLGIAGAIYKRRWEVTGQRVDLESALFCYRLGYEQNDHPERWYAGLNAAFVADRLARLERDPLGDASRATALQDKAREIREAIVANVPGGDKGWHDATRGEALFGLDKFDDACEPLAAVAENTKELWRQETTAMQLAALAEVRKVDDNPEAIKALRAFVGGHTGALRRVSVGKVGLALSGGGFRASLFHIGVLARLAECNVLRRVEVLSCVSGGSILGAYYYLMLRSLLHSKPDGAIEDREYVDLVHELAEKFLAAVGKDLRGRLGRNPGADAKMLLTKYSRTDRVGELLEELFYGPLREGETGPWRMPDLFVKPDGRDDFSLRYENWLREAKVPILVLNATTLNTGHSWQFTASWMGEPPSTVDERVDASRRLRRVYYRDAPDVDDLQQPTLGSAVAASACVPGLFPPITIRRLYEKIDVELVDGGVHDNQGIASLVEQDCNVILVSDASGQLRDAEDPKRWMPNVGLRSNSILMKRVRGAQYGELLGRRRSGALRGFMGVHLTKGLAAPPRTWIGGSEAWMDDEDALVPEQERPYGIDPDVQRLLAELRTDLDAFSDDEAYGLMATGYLMTKRDLHEALPELAQADPKLERKDWPFAKVLAEMTSQDVSRLKRSLRYGHHLLFRKARALASKLPFID